jgi:hypothetical protein
MYDLVLIDKLELRPVIGVISNQQDGLADYFKNSFLLFRG